MTRIVTFIYLIITASFKLYSQVGQCPMQRPELFENPTENIEILSKVYSRGQSCDDMWMVRADREGLKTDRGIALEFRQLYLVIEEKEDHIRIASANIDYSTNRLTSRAKDLGWIEKRKMLLWQEGLVSQDQYRIKVIATHTLTSIQESSVRELNSKRLIFYSAPNYKEAIKSKTGAFRYYFIFKKENGFYLLGRRNFLSDSGLDLLGWVSERQVIPWNSRKVLEPNWDSSAIEERMNASTPVEVTIFDSESDATSFLENPGVRARTVWNDGFSEERWDPYIERLPVFETKKIPGKDGQYLYRTGIVGKPRDENGIEINGISSDDLARLKELKAEQETRSRRINIVFVIDATSSMQDYINATKSALDQVMSKLSFSGNDFRYGLSVYRDYKNVSSNCLAFEGSNTLQDARIIREQLNLLRDCEDGGFKDDYEESVNQGLIYGINMFQQDELANNIIILIGDAGSNPQDLTLENDVLRKLRRFNVNLIALQARSENVGSAAPYDLFVDRLRPLILRHARETTNEKSANWDNQDLFPRGNIEFIPLAERRTHLELNKEYSFVFGSMDIATSSRPSVRPGEVASEIVKQIEQIDLQADQLLSRVTDMIDRTENFDNSYYNDNYTLDIDVIEFWLNAGVEQDKIDGLLRSQYRFLLEGYAVSSAGDLTHPLFNLGLFVDQEELDVMKRRLKDFLSRGRSINEKREQFKRTFSNVITEIYGEGDVLDNLREAKLSELLGKITGIESTNSILQRHTLDTIRRLSEVELNSLQFEIQRKLNLLESRLYRGGPYTFIDNTNVYHWVPFSFLP